MNKSKYILYATSLALVGIQACKKDHDDHNHDNELITTVKLSLTSPSGTVSSASWKDLTPNEPSGQMIDTLKVDSGVVYIGKIEMLDETKNPTDNISEEVKKEANDHLFVYTQIPASPEIIKVDRTDKDSKNFQVGLEFTFNAVNKGTGKLNVVLKHQPGQKDGTPGPGDADFNIEIPFISKGKL